VRAQVCTKCVRAEIAAVRVNFEVSGSDRLKSSWYNIFAYLRDSAIVFSLVSAWRTCASKHAFARSWSPHRCHNLTGYVVTDDDDNRSKKPSVTAI